MIRFVFATVLFLTGCASVYPDSFEAVSSEQRLTNKTMVTWELVDDIDAFCKKRNDNIPKDNIVLACAIPTKQYCKIYTASVTSMSALGHEIRHCFEGAWHK
jgi:5,10-methenyltetrahydromethanopterin hydrogenase